MTDFLPQGQVTGIGSLPHLDPDDAIRFIAENSPAIPFWPQQPGRSDDEMMIVQMLAPLLDILQPQGAARFDIPSDQLNIFRQRLREADAVFDPASAAGFYAFERACQSGQFAQATALKGQLTGPITLAHCLFADDKPLVALPETFMLFTDYLCRLGRWQIERLRPFNKPVLIFIDEPALSLGASSPQSQASLKQLINTLRTAEAYVGLHCCATDLPDLICRVQPDIISFDAHQGLETFLSNPHVQRFVAAGGWLALGLAPTWNDLSLFDPLQAFMRLVTTAEPAYDLPQLVAHCFITATCGLGLLNVDSARASFAQSHALSRLVQKTVTMTELGS